MCMGGTKSSTRIYKFFGRISLLMKESGIIIHIFAAKLVRMDALINFFYYLVIMCLEIVKFR